MSSFFDDVQKQCTASTSGTQASLRILLSIYRFVTLFLFFPSFRSLLAFLISSPCPLSFHLPGRSNSVHGEQGCSRRHLWKRALATDLSSSAIPGQGRLQGTLAVRRHTLDEGGRMRQEERERNKCNGRETGKQSLKRKKNVVLIIYSWFCQARKHENEIRMSEE